MQFIKSFMREEEGQDAVEYGVLIAAIGLALFAVGGAFQTQLATAFTDLGTEVTSAFKMTAP